MGLKNRVVADDLYEFLFADKLIMDVKDNHLIRFIDDKSSMHYPYDNEDDAWVDSITIGKMRVSIHDIDTIKVELDPIKLYKK